MPSLKHSPAQVRHAARRLTQAYLTGCSNRTPAETVTCAQLANPLYSPAEWMIAEHRADVVLKGQQAAPEPQKQRCQEDPADGF
ncbi:hypothetical protein [Pseudomonas purpurea]|uniref:hypothetical protein n=1 Tax=Pseudomonas purpurea TaxID=3136737 RepID=UPI00326715D8